jgi:cytochrome c oxidase cbb3-type subunit 3
MNKMYVLGALFVVILMGITWQMAGGNIGENDYMGLLAVAGAGAIALISVVVVIKYVRQMQTDTATGELASDSWDGIGEYKNELPFGWAIIFFGLTIWAIWYFLVGYPVNAYSQIGEYNEEVNTHNASFSEKYAKLNDEQKHEMGNNLFSVQCAPCHGSNAKGLGGKAANLTNRISAESVRHVITNGANNFEGTYYGMPAADGLYGMTSGRQINAEEIDTIVEYVSGGFAAGHAGEAVFADYCASCHGDGTGIEGVGPNIKSFDNGMVATVLKHGKKGTIGGMPAFTNLSADQVDAVSIFVSNISK